LAFGANIPTCSWIETIIVANYFINLSPTRTNGGLNPHQQLFMVLPNFHHLRVFGCVSFVHISVHKLHGHLNLYIHVFISYNSTSKGIVVSTDVIFYEDHFGFPLIIIIISTIVEPCITFFAIPLLNLGATPP
jgi:hypothetical protein